jgi:hypothetical protein
VPCRVERAGRGKAVRAVQPLNPRRSPLSSLNHTDAACTSFSGPRTTTCVLLREKRLVIGRVMHAS